MSKLEQLVVDFDERSKSSRRAVDAGKDEPESESDAETPAPVKPLSRHELREMLRKKIKEKK